MSSQYDNYIKNLNQFYNKDNIFKSESYVINSKFTMTIDYYKAENHPNITKATIYNLLDKKVIELNRNYSNFPFITIKHTNGNEYLIYGEEYQGFTILNLNTLKKINHYSQFYYKRKGDSPYEWKYDDKNNILYITACDYYGKELYLIYDFEFPEERSLPQYR